MQLSGSNLWVIEGLAGCLPYYEQGKDDPNLALLRLTAETAEFWENAFNLLAGIKALFGSDPKEDFKDKVAEVLLRQG